jgi:hypothetical protein
MVLIRLRSIPGRYHFDSIQLIVCEVVMHHNKQVWQVPQG